MLQPDSDLGVTREPDDFAQVDSVEFRLAAKGFESALARARNLHHLGHVDRDSTSWPADLRPLTSADVVRITAPDGTVSWLTGRGRPAAPCQPRVASAQHPQLIQARKQAEQLADLVGDLETSNDASGQAPREGGDPSGSTEGTKADSSPPGRREWTSGRDALLGGLPILDRAGPAAATLTSSAIDSAGGQWIDARPAYSVFLRESGETHTKLSSQKVGSIPDLPLVSPPRIGLFGWWQLTNELAALVWPGVRDGTVVTIDFITWESGSDHLSLEPRRTTLIADGLRFSIIAPWTGDTLPAIGDRAPWTATAAILMASTLVQANPHILPSALDTDGARIFPAVEYTNGSYSGRWPNGLRWHMVRGHWRRFRSPRFTHMRGETIWIHPHARGASELGQSTNKYLVNPPST